MSRIVSWVSPLLIATMVFAQQGPPDSKPATPATAAERLQALKDGQKQLVDAWQKTVREAQAAAKDAKTSGKAIPAMPMRPDFSPLVGMAQSAAKDFAGTDDAVQFLTYIVQNGGTNREAVMSALETLTDKHLAHKDVAALAPMLPFLDRIVGEKDAPRFLERFEKSGQPDIIAWIAFGKHKAAIETGDREGDGYKSAKTALVTAAANATDKRIKEEIQGAIDTREKFGAGNVAPDIAGVDLDEVPFKLSDYKGKVVFLDFWGDW